MSDEYFSPATGYLQTESPLRVEAVGSDIQCGRRRCRNTNPTWRVLLGGWRVQVYTCSLHLGWACRLDSIREKAALAMGWRRHIERNAQIEKPTQVVPTLYGTTKTNYNRDLFVGETFPVTQRNVINPDRIDHYWR